DHDVGVGVAGVEMVDRDPVEPGAEVLLHLPHQVAGEGAQIRELVAILRSDDEAELMAVLSAALREGAPVGPVSVGTVQPAALAIAGRTVALEIADMGIGGAAADFEPHDPR